MGLTYSPTRLVDTSTLSLFHKRSFDSLECIRDIDQAFDMDFSNYSDRHHNLHTL